MSDLIFTSKGLLPVDSLTYSEGGIDNENEHTTWQEWRDGSGEIVKRAVQVRIKRGVELQTEIGSFG